MSAAIVDGLELAGRAKHLDGDRETVAREAAARIVSDMILAGQGADVLKLAAVMDRKSAADGGGDGEDSPVLAALRRMPGLAQGLERSTEEEPAHDTRAASDTYTPGTSDSNSGGRDPGVFFAPQLPLLGAAEPADDDAGPGGGGGGGGGPPPPPAPPPVPLYTPPRPVLKKMRPPRERRAVPRPRFRGGRRGRLHAPRGPGPDPGRRRRHGHRRRSRQRHLRAARGGQSRDRALSRSR